MAERFLDKVGAALTSALPAVDFSLRFVVE